MRPELFRAEALESSRDRLFGEVALHRPLSITILTGCAAAIVVAIVAFIFWGDYTRKARVTGYLAPSLGLIRVQAPETGTLIEKNVREGQAVRRGDTLFVLSTERTSRESPEAQSAAIDKLRERRASLVHELHKEDDLARIEQDMLAERIRGTGAECEKIAAQIRVQAERLANAREALGRFERLSDTRMVSVLQLIEQKQQVLEQESALQALERERVTRENELAQLRLQTGADELKATNRRAAVAREVAALEQQITEYESRRNVVITAPADGAVTAILAENGQTVQTATALLSIIPEGGELEAHLLVPSRAIGFIAAGQSVALRYQAFPYQRFGSYAGEVKEIAKTVTSPAELNAPVKLDEPVYRIRVALGSQAVAAYGEPVPLTAGMVVDADISLDRRRLVAWIFDPVLSVTRKL